VGPKAKTIVGLLVFNTLCTMKILPYTKRTMLEKIYMNTETTLKRIILIMVFKLHIMVKNHLVKTI
jgi:hypothetical protein